MNDTRLATLAEALKATLGAALPAETDADWRLTAAALPPDWCGHDAWWTAERNEVMAELARLREQNDGLYAAVQMGAKEQDRLRAIEEAARTLQALIDEPMTPASRRNAARDALRAALGSES